MSEEKMQDESVSKVIIDNKVVAVDETKVVLNWSAPSPKIASQIFNIWLALATILALGLATFADEIPDGTEALVNKTIVFITGALRIITKAFGLEPKES